MSRWRTALIALLLAGATLCLYWPVRHFQFVDYDDNILVTDNAVVKSGLNWASVRWALTTPVVAIWHPVTTLSHMLDCQLFGVQPGPPHLVNAALHAASALLLFLALRRLTRSTWRSAVVAGLFALHPLRVESVAWISERKDVLSGFFFMLTLWAWGKTVISNQCSVISGQASISERANVDRRWYAVALLCFALGLMSKPMLVTLPFVLLLLDYWPLGRVRSRGSADGGVPAAECRPQSADRRVQRAESRSPMAKGNRQKENVLRLVWEKWPFFALSALFCVLTFYFQRTGSAVVTMDRVGLGGRLANAVVSYWRYLGKFFWPTDLASIYPHPSNPYPLVDRWAGWQTWLGAMALVAVTLLFVVQGWEWLGAKAEQAPGHAKSGSPSGTRSGAIFNFSFSIFHFSIPRPTCAPYLLVGWLWFLGTLVPVIGLVQVGGLAMADRYTYIPLIGVAIAVVWGVAELINPKSEIRNSKQIQIPNSEIPMDGRRIGSFGLGAVIAVSALVACAAATHQQLGYWHDTISLFEHTIDVTADNPGAHFGLGIGLQKAGQTKRAMTEYRVALAIDPSLAEAQFNMGQVLREEGQLEEAAREYEKVFRTYPDHYLAHFNLGGVYWLLGRRPEAIVQMEAAIRSDAASADALNNLAWWLAAGPDAKYRDGARAVALAERACALTGYKRPLMIGTLAAAYAEAGRFGDAVSAAQRAKDVAEQAGDAAIAQKNAELMQLYSAGKAYHEADTGNSATGESKKTETGELDTGK